MGQYQLRSLDNLICKKYEPKKKSFGQWRSWIYVAHRWGIFGWTSWVVHCPLTLLYTHSERSRSFEAGLSSARRADPGRGGFMPRHLNGACSTRLHMEANSRDADRDRASCFKPRIHHNVPAFKLPRKPSKCNLGIGITGVRFLSKRSLIHCVRSGWRNL